MNAMVQTRMGRHWWVLLVYGLIWVVFGAIALLRPFAAVAALTWAFGLMALAEGTISAVAWFDTSVSIPKGWLALYAVASIAFGAIALANPIATAGFLLMFLAAWLIVAGIYRIVLAIRVRAAIQGEWMIVLSGVLAIGLGLLFILHPLAGLLGWMIWVGIAAIVYGILQMIAAVRMRTLARVA